MAGRAAPSLPVQATSGTSGAADQSERAKAVGGGYLLYVRRYFLFNPLDCASDRMMDANKIKECM